MRTPRLILIIAAFFLLVVAACHSSNNVIYPVSFTVVNAMPESNPLISMFGSDTTNKYFKDALSLGLSIPYPGSLMYSQLGGPTPLRIAPKTDTFFNIYNHTVNLTSGKIYTFFLVGDTLHADTMLVEDHIPNYTDSSTGVRFVNLSIGGKSLTVNLASDPTHPIATLGYRNITDFAKYAANSSVGGVYNLEIRDAATGDLLTTYDWYYTLYKNNTLVISGSTDPSNFTLTTFSVNNY